MGYTPSPDAAPIGGQQLVNGSTQLSPRFPSSINLPLRRGRCNLAPKKLTPKSAASRPTPSSAALSHQAPQCSGPKSPYSYLGCMSRDQWPALRP